MSLEARLLQYDPRTPLLDILVFVETQSPKPVRPKLV